MLRLCSESSRFYPGRSVRHAFALCESALCGNMQGDRAEVSRGHSRCWKSPLADGDWKRAVTHNVENITEVSSH
jgi:hypothetical protein